MCGGRGSRLHIQEEKPLVPISGRPMVDHVVDALEASRIDRIVGVVTDHTPDTATHLRSRIEVIRTAGNSYCEDVGEAIDRLGLSRVVTVGADLPLIDGATMNRILVGTDEGRGSTAICVSLARKRTIGTSIDDTLEPVEVDGRRAIPSGINVVDREAPETRYRLVDAPALAVNVNRPRDAWIAEVLAP